MNKDDGAAAHDRFRVLYADTDAMGQAYYGNYLKWFEFGRAEWFRRRGMSYRRIEAAGIYLPVIEAHCCYKKPAFYDEVLSILTRFHFNGPARLRFDYQIKRNEELLADGFTVHVCVNRERKVLKPPDDLRSLLESQAEGL
ncbi:acyl-CoA thioesterase [Desulfoferrobacter suflitae]|uniref:acyl-CoA thioesterase n=1 Tax=Desulfoferrobacter suflitae TaxID=2865782 RepID=UPI002164601A|nr:thioesterase family protein [Desulfoferrobacter suflitae]MCK8601392.1 acyl-CoA thioesterase [Desulfoferrobacter suflitae]